MIEWCFAEAGDDDDMTVAVLFNEDFESDCYGEETCDD